MNSLQKLIKLRGMTIKQVADRIGHGYHFTQKVIKRTTTPLKSGGTYTYKNRAIEEGVAELLGLSHSQAWGRESCSVLHRLIREEIRKQAKQREHDLQQQWLNTDRIAEKQVTGNV